MHVKIPNMEIIEHKETWIHTHYIVDSYFITEPERRQISINVEPQLYSIGIRYGLDYDIDPAKHRAIIILECIPFESVIVLIKGFIDEVIKDFPVRHPQQRNVVTNISVEDALTDVENTNDQGQDP